MVDASGADKWERVATTEAIPEGEVIAASVAGQQIALYNIEGQIYASNNICTHEHAYLSDGYLEGCVIECPLHQGQFDIRTGKAMCAPVTQDLPVYPVKIEGGEVFIDLSGT